MPELRSRVFACSPRWAVVPALALCGLAGCLLDDRQAKRGSEVENELHGRLVDAGGVPVSGAWVTAVRADEFLLKPGTPGRNAARPESVETDVEGRYGFKSLDPGEYNLAGNYRAGSLAVLIAGVYYVDTTRPQDVGVDTLRPPGTIQGGVLAGGRGQEGAMCYLPGTSYLSITDDSGGCLLQHIPQGRYRVKYALPGYATGVDTGVAVSSQRVTILPFKVLDLDTAMNPPPPAELRGEPDTLAGVVRLRWPSVAVGDLEGYQVWRDTGNGDLPHLVTLRPVTDTAYIDTVAHLLRPGKPRRFGYRVKAMDRGRNASLFFSPSLSLDLVAASDVRTVIVADLGDRPTLPMVPIGDTLRLVIRYANATRPVTRIEWYAGDRDTLVASKELSSLQGRDTLRFSRDQAGRYVLRCVVTDGYGRITTRVFTVEVGMVPRLHRMVSIGDTVHLEGAGIADGADSASGYAWDIGNTGTFQVTPGGRISFPAPMEAARIDCLLRVVYANGSERTYLVRVLVDWDPPEPAIIAPLEAYAGDTLTVSGEGSLDGQGKVVKWEWDFGGKGLFTDGSGPELRFPAPLQAVADYPCSLRVTDDDGQSATRGVLIQVRDAGDGRWIKVSGPQIGFSALHAGEKVIGWQRIMSPAGSEGLAAFSSRDMMTWKHEGDAWFSGGTESIQVHYHAERYWLFRADSWDNTFRLHESPDGVRWNPVDLPETVSQRMAPSISVFRGRLWILGGFDSTGYRSDAWSSADGRTWARATAAAAFGGRSDFPVLAYRDKLWVYGGISAEEEWNRDLWSSPDGIAWRWVTGFSTFPDLLSPKFLASRGKLRLMGGVIETGTFKMAAWSSEDGIQWIRDSEDTGLPEGGSYFEYQGIPWFINAEGEAWRGPVR